MKVAVIGAGIVGIATAYELAMDGHEVSVFERRGAAAEEASFANAGMTGAGHVAAWATPAMPGKMLGQLLRRHAALRLSLPLSGSDLAWLWQWRRTSKLEAHLASCARLQQLALYSRHRLHLITAQHQLDYERSPGCLVMLRDEKDLRQLQPGLQILQEAGVPFTQLDADAVRQIEPALNPDTRFLGALHLPEDEVVNCRQFALLLKNEAQRLGAHFKFNTAVAQLDRVQPATLLVAGEDKLRRFDQVIMCAGLASAELLRPLGLSIPMAAVYGYSVSAPVRESLNAPGSALLDERYQVTISRLGNRIRVSGGAEIGGAPERQSPAALETLYKVLRDWYPGAAQHSGASGSVQVWKGARPMLPDGQPIIGNSGRPGLWLNVGHGNSGWALSCGSARALADLMAGKAAEIDMQGLGLRYPR
jgi:D-amino-acid dehydrogenase